MKLWELLALQEHCHGDGRLARNVGDGYLYVDNPYYRRVRRAALARGFRFTLGNPGGYFGFPLSSLDEVLRSRRIPYRDNLTALEKLEAARPRFFSLADLSQNRPTPNYVMHEAAHAVAYHEAFGRPSCPTTALARRDNLPRVVLGEAFAMTTEYLAACSIGAGPGRWLFSINSYRHRTQAKQSIGELIAQLGLCRVVWSLLGAFLYSNYLRESLRQRDLERWLAQQPTAAKALTPRQLHRLARALSRAMQMSREFRVNTARLFLGKLGYPRDIERLLASDPQDAMGFEDLEVSERLVQVLVSDDETAQSLAASPRTLTG